jgi:hypothetical protein
MEGIMRKVTARAVAQPVSRPSFAAEWSLALWILAAAFLLVTFQVY